MGNRFRKGQFSKRKGGMGDLRPGQRSQIRVKSEQAPPPFKRYGSFKPEIPWPDRLGPRQILGENHAEIQKSLKKFGEAQPGFEYRQTDREAQRAAQRKTGPGKAAKLLKTATQLPGLPDGSPQTKFRSGMPRAISALGIPLMIFKDRKRIWKEAGKGRLGNFTDLRVFRSWLATQPPGTTIPGDLPVIEAVDRHDGHICDVGSKERTEKGTSISSDEFAFRKDTDGIWHLIPAPAYVPRSYQRFLPKNMWPKWMKGEDGHWHFVSAQEKDKFVKQSVPAPKRIVTPPSYMTGAKTPGFSYQGAGMGPGGMAGGMFKPHTPGKIPGLPPNYGPPKTNFPNQTQLGPINPHKPKTIFDPPGPIDFGARKTGTFGPRVGIPPTSGLGISISEDIRSKFRPRPTGGRLPQPGPTFTSAGSTFTSSGSSFHTVRPGENLTRIANQYGSSVNAFAQNNQWLHNRQGRILKGIHFIRPGERLSIPGSGFNR